MRINCRLAQIIVIVLEKLLKKKCARVFLIPKEMKLKGLKSAAMAVIMIAAGTLGTEAEATETFHAPSQGNFMVRILGSGVLPDGDLNSLRANGGPNIAAGNDVEISDEFIPAATLTYFFTPNIAAELFCCFAKHNIEAKGNISALGEIADFWIFPPSLTLTYHFDGGGALKPYVGAGVTYIHFFDEGGGQSAGNALFGGAALQKTEIDDAFGFALQAGIDLDLGRGWSLNADVKKIFLETDATWRFAGGNTLKAEVDVDPWIVSAGIGYRFDLGNVFGRRPIEPLK